MSSRKRPTHGFGSYDRDYDQVEGSIDDLHSAMGRAHRAMSRLYDAVESGSHGQLFKAKESAKDAYAELSSRLESARTTDSARGRSLDRLPKHAPFDKAHRLVRELRTTIDDAERLRKRLSRSIYGDAEQIRAALRSEGDPRRRRRRR